MGWKYDADLLETSVHDLQFFAAELGDSTQLVDAFRFAPHQRRLSVIQTVTCDIRPIHTKEKLKEAYSSLCYKHRTATGTHVPYGITQYYLPPGRGDIPAFTPTNVGWYSI